MRILQIIYSLSSGGAERLVVDLCNELANKEQDVILCVICDDSIEKMSFYKFDVSSKVTYVNLKFSDGISIINLYKLFLIIKKYNPKVVHFHQVKYPLPLSILFPKIKFVNTIHTDPIREVSNYFEYWIKRILYLKKIIYAVTISQATSISFVQYYKHDKFKQILNGRYMPTPSNKYAEVVDFFNNIRKDTKTVFLHVGRCLIEKNQELLIKVFNRVIAEGYSVSLIIIGSGFDTELGKNLISISNEKILFVGERKNVTDYFMNADAFCLSSTTEGMPITLIEAFACGCIPICTPVGGITETINKANIGFLADSISEDSYYTEIIKYIKQKDFLKNEDLKEYFDSHFSINQCAMQYLNLYLNN